MHLSALIATGLYVGKFPKAPGTVGSVATFGWVYLLAMFLGLPMVTMLQNPILMFGVMIIIYGIGTWATQNYMNVTGKEDPKEVVIDEVAGQWLTLALTAPILVQVGESVTISFMIFYYLLCFGFFRLFDIVKMGPVKWADTKIDGAHGVMLDDIFAGALAAIGVYVVLFIFLYV